MGFFLILSWVLLQNVLDSTGRNSNYVKENVSDSFYCSSTLWIGSWI